MITQLNPPIPLDTPKGAGLAHLVIDYGPESNLIWVCFIDSTGECWAYDNTLVRAQKNITLGRRTEPSIYKSIPIGRDAEYLALLNRVTNFNSDGKADVTMEWEKLCDEILAYLEKNKVNQ